MHLVGAIGSCGQAELTAGNPAAAIDHFRQTYAMRETEVDRALLPALGAELAAALASTGHSAEAESLAMAARAGAGPDGFDVEVLWRRALALVGARAGCLTEAVTLAEEATARTAASDWLSFHGATLETLASVRTLAKDVRGATAALHDALAAYERKGNVARAETVRRKLRGE